MDYPKARKEFWAHKEANAARPGRYPEILMQRIYSSEILLRPLLDKPGKG
jgi:hypothetical protein